MRPTSSLKGVIRLAALALASTPAPALACPVCFGMLEGPVADGTNKAILVLLAITGSVLAGFASFIIYLVRRSRVVVSSPVGVPSAAAVLGASAGSEAPRGGAVSHVSEGTA